MNSDHLMFPPPGLHCKNSYKSWLLPCHFGAIPQSDLRGHLLGLSPQVCPNKTYFSTFRLGIFPCRQQDKYPAVEFFQPMGRNGNGAHAPTRGCLTIASGAGESWVVGSCPVHYICTALSWPLPSRSQWHPTPHVVTMRSVPRLGPIFPQRAKSPLLENHRGFDPLKAALRSAGRGQC